MKIRDISLKKRLLVGNFLMVIIPVLLLAIMGWIIFLGFRFIDTGQKSGLLSIFFRENSSELEIQFAISSIKTAAAKGDHLKLKNLRKSCKILETQGISTMILQEGRIIYATPNADCSEIVKKISARKNKSPSMLIWDEKGFAFLCTSKKHRAIIMAVGNTPFEQKNHEPPPFPIKKFLEIAGITLLVCSIMFIIVLGRYLSRLLSRQILEPLEKLREVAENIREGNLNVALNIDSQDEIGKTCRDFENMRRELKKYEINRKELIAGISHDLATPLTALKGYASGILDGVANTPEKIIHYVEMMNQTVCSMEKLVESLFLFSKLDLGRIEFNLEPVRLSDYFSDYISDKKEYFSQRGLILKLLDDKKTPLVKIDRLQFTRLTENLLENAIKYKRSENVQMIIDFAVEGRFLRVNFADNGRGVPKSELGKIFEIFYRTDRARTKVSKGSGLGLAIVKQIVAGMGGNVHAEETFGGGLTISLYLPIFEEEKHEKNTFD